ncbi:junB proto-oncogene, AP-1 transcription factor subunit b [Pygocentrus nattereri]|uniref:junB proto-oncogene, AP-1 transcription factor subunit b n=1 Tax=Pygocentrus nattereri TaxID=42514 RepID=UPI0008143179|nr:junB proto-oncogene, AP-1 transcription factor subunit b [Pygocentrus nattereri]
MSTKMEQPFYHDDSFLLGYGHSDAALHDYKLQKQAMNLNLSEPYRSLKSETYQVASADAASLKLASPELERLIIQNSNGVITSPTPGQYLYGRGITDEQEGFAEGFVKALDELHKMNQQPPPNVSIGAGGVTCAAAAAASVFGSSLQPEPPIYTTLNTYCPTPSLSSSASSSSSSVYPSATISYLPPHIQQQHHHHQHQQQAAETTSAHAFQNLLPGSSGVLQHRFPALKEEPQTVPEMHATSSDHGSPPMSPIDLETQEKIKAERKRLRNRLAATKCRRRKLERIARLEDRVKVLKSDNAGLSSTASVLREQVAQLKQKVLRHVSSGCQLMLTSKMEAF